MHFLMQTGRATWSRDAPQPVTFCMQLVDRYPGNPNCNARSQHQLWKQNTWLRFMQSKNACGSFKGVLGEMGLFVDPITLYMDSKSAICLAKNPLYHKRSKHIDIKFHWIREKVLGELYWNISVLTVWMQISLRRHWNIQYLLDMQSE